MIIIYTVKTVKRYIESKLQVAVSATSQNTTHRELG